VPDATKTFDQGSISATVTHQQKQGIPDAVFKSFGIQPPRQESWNIAVTLSICMTYRDEFKIFRYTGQRWIYQPDHRGFVFPPTGVVAGRWVQADSIAF
jgi:hypothetical protein